MVRWSALGLGKDHPTFGAIHVEVSPDGRAALAISAGADPDSPARAGKGDPDQVPNEDAALVIDEGERVLIAVADAHFGHQASHALLRALGRAPAPPLGIEDLRAFLASIPSDETGSDRSETTLAVAVLDRVARRVFGLSFGDSTVLLLGAGSHGEPLHRRDDRFVTPARPQTMLGGEPFTRERVAPEQVLVAFTDGVDGCCYGDPERSLRAEHLVAMGRRARSVEELVRGVAESALAGVEGAPGGQDNIAIVAARG
jgi:hypothetical protein